MLHCFRFGTLTVLLTTTLWLGLEPTPPNADPMLMNEIGVQVADRMYISGHGICAA